MKDITRKESTVLINSLTSGVVPRIGLRHIAVGRQAEVRALLNDLSMIENGGASFRFVSGMYGSGKSFLLQMIRNNAMERSFVVMDADLSPERRLTGTRGQGIATYRELLSHMSTNSTEEGNVLEIIIRQWLDTIDSEMEMTQKISALTNMPYGYAFTSVLKAYWRGMKEDQEHLVDAAKRWLKAEYQTKTEAKHDLPVDRIIDDQNWYEFIKLFARFVKIAGYKGLVVFIDEGVNLYKISNKQARDNNYEKLLSIFNDTMQGKAEYIGFIISGTPQFIYDERRGLFSYDALRTRLADNRFSSDKYVDYTSPIIKLKQLEIEEVFLLLENLNKLHKHYYNYDGIIGEDEIKAFLSAVYLRIGADTLMTPREVTKDFIGLLNVLLQNPELKFEDLISESNYKVIGVSKNPEELDEETDMFTEFEL